MTAVKGWRRTVGSPAPLIRDYLVEASQTIRAGDIVVLAGYTLADRVRRAVTADLDFQQAAAITGLLGVAWHSIATDVNGTLLPIVPSTVDPGAIVNYPAIGYSGLTDRPTGSFTGTTPDIGSARLAVAVFDDTFEFLMDCCGAANANVTVGFSYVGKSAGLQQVSTDTKIDLSVTSGNPAGVVITGVAEREVNYNVAANVNNALWASIKSTHQQLTTGLLF